MSQWQNFANFIIGYYPKAFAEKAYGHFFLSFTYRSRFLECHFWPDPPKGSGAYFWYLFYGGSFFSEKKTLYLRKISA